MDGNARRELGTLVLLGTLIMAALPAGGEDPGNTVSMPWPELRRLLELDSDEITLSWDDLQRILVQTGQQALPDIPVQDGKVVLTRAQLTALLAAMKPPPEGEPAPPADYLITRARYRGTLQESSGEITRRVSTVTFRADLTLDIFARDSERYVKVPLFPRGSAVREILLDGEPALLVLEGGHHTLTTRASGRHQVSVAFAIAIPDDRNRQAFSFPIPETPITELEVDFPLREIEVEVSGAQQTLLERRDGGTRVSALLAPARSLSVKWRRSLPEVEKGPAKVYADTLNHLSIEDDALRIEAEISLTVLQNTIPSLVLQVPASCSVLDVRGSGLGDWRELLRDGGTFLEIPFDYPQKGSFSVTVVAEKLLPEESMATDFTGFVVVDAIRDKGYVGIELKSTSEVTLADSTGLDTLDVSQLPATLINRSQKPLLLGFKYLHHPFSLVLDIAKHEELPVISTVVDAANGVTLFTEDGKLVHRILFKVRNTSKQFLELQLPEGAQIWSVFVAGETVKPRLTRPGGRGEGAEGPVRVRGRSARGRADNTQKILIPLNRSHQGASGLVAFDVELIFLEKAGSFGGWGSRSARFPVPDVIVSQLLWSVYLPVGYTYFDFGGSLEPEQTARGLRPLLQTRREVITQVAPAASSVPQQAVAAQRRKQASELAKRFNPNLALDQEQLERQMDNEAEFNQRLQQVQTGQVKSTGGLLPIRVQIPTSGQVFRFAKTLVSEEELTIHFSFVSRTGSRALRALLVLLLAVLVWLARRRLVRLARDLAARLPRGGGPALTLLLAVLCWPWSRWLSVVLAGAALASLIHLRLGRKRRTVSGAGAEQTTSTRTEESAETETVEEADGDTR